MSLKKTKRKDLTKLLNQAVGAIKPGSFFITCIRPTKDNTLQLEVCQKRKLGNRKGSLLAVLNAGDNAFRDEFTLLFDWMKFSPEQLLLVFPELKKKVSLEKLKEIAESWTKDSDTGTDAIVYELVASITKVHRPDLGIDVTPIINITEVTEDQIKNYEFYRGEDADEKIEDQIENKHRAMRTSENGEYLVEGTTGSIVYRFVRTNFVEDDPMDIMIENKMTESEYKRRISKRPAAKVGEQSPEEALSGITGSDHI